MQIFLTKDICYIVLICKDLKKQRKSNRKPYAIVFIFVS
jgi:hypothetical protein